MAGGFHNVNISRTEPLFLHPITVAVIEGSWSNIYRFGFVCLLMPAQARESTSAGVSTPCASPLPVVPISVLPYGHSDSGCGTGRSKLCVALVFQIPFRFLVQLSVPGLASWIRKFWDDLLHDASGNITLFKLWLMSMSVGFLLWPSVSNGICVRIVLPCCGSVCYIHFHQY
jgi:hypothetical protein